MAKSKTIVGDRGLKPGEKRVPSTYKPLESQNVDNIRPMSPADTATFSKKGYRVDMERSRSAGYNYHQPEYIKLATPKPTAKKAASSVTAKPANTTKKTVDKKPQAAKDVYAYRTQTIINPDGSKTLKKVAYAVQKGGKGQYVNLGTPTYIDNRSKGK